MILDNAIEIKVPQPDSQYRLKSCRCRSDNVAYVLGVDGKWRVQCFDCGHTGATAEIRHDAQIAWNEVVA